MKLLGNIIWVFLAGWELAVGWFLAGCLWSITIVGIPIGIQCFKLAGLGLWPFGREIIYEGGGVDMVVNLLWMIFSGIWLAIGSVCLGILFCFTIIGIPFGLQYFKFARLALMPFGAKIVPIYAGL